MTTVNTEVVMLTVDKILIKVIGCVKQNPTCWVTVPNT